MRLLHDRLYGEGTGQIFLRGDYLADLPRYAYAPPPSTNPGQLSPGTELMVVNVRANDILKMREDATDESPVIDTIPPNVRGVIYLGETQGQWIFVQYDRAKGWVNRRFVVPLASRGGRIQ
jgi:hypothetical protein